MKPHEILSMLPQWADAAPEALLDSPAWAMPCRLGEDSTALRTADVRPCDTLDLAVLLDINTYNKLDEIKTALDLGVRYRYRPSSYIAFDGYLDLSETSQSALAFTIGTQQFIAKCFANYYELRAGFLEGAAGKKGDQSGYVKFSGSMIPTLVFGQVFRLFLEVTSSASIGLLKDDFMVDIIPKIELTFGGTHIRIDFDVGVMQEKNNDVKTIALYVMTAL